jgi:ankyrin repeat protein
MVFVTSLFDQNNNTPNKYFRLIIFRNNDKWGSKNYNKVIILSEKYSLKNCSTNVIKDIRYLSNVFNQMHQYDFNFAYFWYNNKLSLQYLIWSLEMSEFSQNKILDCASYYNYMNILDGFSNLGLISLLESKYTDYALNWASQEGHINVLEWWKKSNLKLKYTDHALDWASLHGHINVLEWWKKSNLKLKYTSRALNWASESGHINVLEWWKNSGLKLKYDSCMVIENKTPHGHIIGRSKWWWESSGLIINYY